MTIPADDLLLLEKGMLVLPEGALPQVAPDMRVGAQDLGTVLANMAYFGVAPSACFLRRLQATDKSGLTKAWLQVESLLQAGTGADRNMGEMVVYKNFPTEVLEMTYAQYWVRQVLMYLGMANEMLTQPALERDPLDEHVDLKIIKPVDRFERDALCETLKQSSTCWRPIELEAAAAIFLRAESGAPGKAPINVADYGYRSNALALALHLFPANPDIEVITTSATDVLRLAAGLCGGDVEMKVPPRFTSLSRPVRRKLVAMLEQAVDLQGDFARRPQYWKQLLSRLHPGEFKAPRVSAAYDALYNGLPDRFNARLEAALKAADPAALDILASEPGTFSRDLTRAWNVFGREALLRFETLLPKLTTDRLLQLEKHLETLDLRNSRLVRPRGRWSALQVIDMPKSPICAEDRGWLVARLRAERKSRLDAAFPEGIALDADTCDVVLPLNGQDLAPYGPGTMFDIPADVTFLRTASYWKHSAHAMNTWFDNGWNFFTKDWAPAGACCWNSERLEDAAVFSGDPTNSKDLEGRGCQMIDLYFDRLADMGIAYGVWSLLCYSHIPFDQAEDVIATLQWGEKPEAGNLYEPSRAQMTFPVKGSDLNRYIAYVDISARKLVSLDLTFPGSLETVVANENRLSKIMPAVVDHLSALPRVHDLFAPAAGGETPVLRSDAKAPVSGRGWVFEPRNEASEIASIDLTTLRGQTRK